MSVRCPTQHELGVQMGTHPLNTGAHKAKKSCAVRWVSHFDATSKHVEKGK
ncbi:MAG: hypothetical protein CLLPBCKN_004094 [Chroococcidiopsis cubana SAG 39.79]|nr:hypothetical protein [Chroococcidiopsis cubana SAG 39.79]